MVAVVIYRVTGLGIHIYTLAGITVSLGIIIDSSIVMADHYSYYRNRSVFPALLGATATTVGALCVIYLLPESERRNLGDFSKVIIINLSVALVTAYAFIPSLIDRFPPDRKQTSATIGRVRRTIRFNRLYFRYNRGGRKAEMDTGPHSCCRIRTAFVSAAAESCGKSSGRQTEYLPEGIQQHYWLEAVCGQQGSHRQGARQFLCHVQPCTQQRGLLQGAGEGHAVYSGRDAEGCTVAQLNDVVKSMENFLGKFSEIESFTTSIRSYDNATIEVTFRPEYENTSFPAELKSQVTAMATNFGGANWRVWGINESYFNNNVTMSYKKLQDNPPRI